MLGSFFRWLERFIAGETIEGLLAGSTSTLRTIVRSTGRSPKNARAGILNPLSRAIRLRNVDGVELFSGDSAVSRMPTPSRVLVLLLVGFHRVGRGALSRGFIGGAIEFADEGGD